MTGPAEVMTALKLVGQLRDEHETLYLKPFSLGPGEQYELVDLVAVHDQIINVTARHISHINDLLTETDTRHAALDPQRWRLVHDPATLTAERLDEAAKLAIGAIEQAATTASPTTAAFLLEQLVVEIATTTHGLAYLRDELRKSVRPVVNDQQEDRGLVDRLVQTLRLSDAKKDVIAVIGIVEGTTELATALLGPERDVARDAVVWLSESVLDVVQSAPARTFSQQQRDAARALAARLDEVGALALTREAFAELPAQLLDFGSKALTALELIDGIAKAYDEPGLVSYLELTKSTTAFAALLIPANATVTVLPGRLTISTVGRKLGVIGAALDLSVRLIELERATERGEDELAGVLGVQVGASALVLVAAIAFATTPVGLAFMLAGAVVLAMTESAKRKNARKDWQIVVEESSLGRRHAQGPSTVSDIDSPAFGFRQRAGDTWRGDLLAQYSGMRRVAEQPPTRLIATLDPQTTSLEVEADLRDLAVPTDASWELIAIGPVIPYAELTLAKGSLMTTSDNENDQVDQLPPSSERLERWRLTTPGERLDADLSQGVELRITWGAGTTDLPGLVIPTRLS